MIAALIALAAPVAPAPPPVQPQKPWVVNYAQTFCMASREYGDAQRPLAFILRPSPNARLLQLFVVRSGTNMSARHEPVTITFAGQTVKATALSYGIKSPPRRFVLTSLSEEATRDIGKAPTVAVRAEGVDVVFAVPEIGKVMAALRTCNADLQAMWNMTDQTKARIATPSRPATRLAHYFTAEDYPSQAIAEDNTGTSKVLLLVDEEGKVSDCLLEESSGNASLDAMTCIRLVQRARFEPARDAAGKAMKSAIYQSISWKIEG